MKKFISLIEQAEKDIEKYKVLDPDLYDVVMDRIKKIEKQMEQSKAEVAEVQRKFEQGFISSEEAIAQSMNDFEKIGKAIREAQNQN